MNYWRLVMVLVLLSLAACRGVGETVVITHPIPPHPPTPMITSQSTPVVLPTMTQLPPLTPTTPGPNYILADNAQISYIGRFDFTDPLATAFDWPGTAIEVAFTGSALTLLLEDNHNLYNLYLDGQPSVLRTQPGLIEYEVAQGLGAGVHTLRLVKRTEYDGDVAVFRGLVLPEGGELMTPPTRPLRRIEVIGDSITAGYGVEGGSPNCSYSLATQNVEQTYGAILGRELGAEVMVTAVSGIGVIRNYAAPGMISANSMLARYEQALADTTTSRWDFRRWKPDVIVINLGTNDFTTQPQPTEAIFVTAYIELLNNIRRHYPLTPIVAVAGPIVQEPLVSYVQTAVQHMNESQHDPHVLFVPIPSLILPDDFGCEYHPNVRGQEKIADELLPTIRANLGW